MSEVGGMTPAHIAVAVVAACGVTGTKPADAFNDGNGQGRTRVMAAAGCMARLGWDKKATARVFRVHVNRLSPSGLVLARVDTEHLLIIAEALAAHGLCEPDDARARFRRPYGPGGGGRVENDPGGPSDHSAPAAAAETPQHKAGGGEAEAEGAVRAETPAEAEPDAVAARRTVTRRADGAGAAIPRRPTASAQRPDHLKTERLKPVTDRVIRWSRQQLALGADIDFVAWCFDVDAEALAERVRPDVGVAA